MKEKSLKPAMVVNGKWTVRRHIANGCIYAVTKDNDTREFALKMREPQNVDRFNREVELLQKINQDGPHPSFQQLIDFNDDPENLYMVLYPLACPERSLTKMSLTELSDIDPYAFIEEVFHAVAYAYRQGAPVINFTPRHIFLTPDNKPFFIDLEDGHTLSYYGLIEFMRIFIKAAEIRGSMDKKNNHTSISFKIDFSSLEPK